MSNTSLPLASFEAFLGTDAPRVIAHRGFSSRAPENTQVAVEMAIDIGADMVEIDVTLSSDGHVVVLHDETLERTTNGYGKAMSHRLEELRRLDAGSWFGDRFEGEKIPTLDEILDQVAGRILLNIEIKTEAVDDRIEGGIAHKVADRVRAHGLEGAVVISSFDPRPLMRLRQLAPEIATASLYARKIHSGMLPSAITARSGAILFNVGLRYLDASMLEDAEEHGLPVAVYTVNRRKDFLRLVDQGVKAVFTDRPDVMLEALGRSLEPTEPEGRID